MSRANHEKLGHRPGEFPRGCGVCRVQSKASVRELCAAQRHTRDRGDGRCLCGMHPFEVTHA